MSIWTDPFEITVTHLHPDDASTGIRYRPVTLLHAGSYISGKVDGWGHSGCLCIRYALESTPPNTVKFTFFV